MLYINNLFQTANNLAKSQDNSGLALQRHENSRDAVLPPTTTDWTADLRQLSMDADKLFFVYKNSKIS